jgi:phosphoserine aminotransferase
MPAHRRTSGPAGVTLVAIRKDLLERSSEKIPTIFRYKTMRPKIPCTTRRPASPSTW